MRMFMILKEIHFAAKDLNKSLGDYNLVPWLVYVIFFVIFFVVYVMQKVKRQWDYLIGLKRKLMKKMNN